MTVRRALILALIPALAATALVVGTAPAHADGSVRVAVVGDSITQFPNSWWHQMHDPAIVDAGGLAVGGATSATIANSITESDPDVLVVEIGTNDVRHGMPLTGLEQNIVKIVGIVHPAHVLLMYLPPSNQLVSPWGHNARVGNLVYTRGLVTLAQQHDWLIADPFAPWRSYFGGYAGGATTDGVHPTTAVSAQIASRMATYIQQADLAALGS